MAAISPHCCPVYKGPFMYLYSTIVYIANRTIYQCFTRNTSPTVTTWDRIRFLLLPVKWASMPGILLDISSTRKQRKMFVERYTSGQHVEFPVHVFHTIIRYKSRGKMPGSDIVHACTYYQEDDALVGSCVLI